MQRKFIIASGIFVLLAISFWLVTVNHRPENFVQLPYESPNRHFISSDGFIEIHYLEIKPHHTIFIDQKAGLFERRLPNIPQIKVSAIIENISDELRFITFQGNLKRRSISKLHNCDQDDFALDPGERKNLTLDLFLKTPGFYELTLQAGLYKNKMEMKSAAAPTFVWDYSISIDSEQGDIVFQP